MKGNFMRELDIREIDIVSGGLSTQELLELKQNLAEWQMYYSTITNAQSSESEGQMAVARNYR
jgi:hypothetical protein